MTRSVFLVVFLVPLLFGPIRTAGAACPAPAVTIASEAMSGSDEQEFEAALRKAVAKVCAWWGADYAGPFTISIEDSRGPSMALVPAWRGQRGTMLFRSRPVRRGRAAITHEVVHVFAPNGNRLLAEGLAVYAQEYLAGQAAYPNDGEDLHTAAKRYAGTADFKALDGTATPTRLETGDLDGREAYIVAGSSVRFLVETYGLEKFRRLYAKTRARNAGDPARWMEIYGKSVEELGKDWQAKIGS